MSKRGLLLVALALLAGACGAPPADIGPPPTMRIIEAPTLAVTVEPTRQAAPTPTSLPTIVPATATPAPTATPGLQFTEEGPITSSMARLRLAPEPFSVLGDPRAPITVVEFSDFGCAFCRRFHEQTFAALRAEYIDTGKVYFVMKDLPITSRHGALAAQAAECAGVQGRYWQMHDALYAEPEAWYGDEAGALERIRAAAAEAGADAAAVAACVASEEQFDNVIANTIEARDLALLGTPNFFIDGKLLAGAQPIGVWRDVLDAALAE
jgi:protein-disulfide isomerase